jgi:hypothetical protein
VERLARARDGQAGSADPFPEPQWDADSLARSSAAYTAEFAKYERVPENDAFWSITVYGSDGFMKSDDNIVNSSNVALNADGTFDVHFGPRDACSGPNRLDVTEGWNFLMRIYRPARSVLEGAYTLPVAEPA